MIRARLLPWLLLPACAAGTPHPSPSDPAPEETVPAPGDAGDPPDLIFGGASVTRYGPDGEPVATVEAGGGRPVAWKESTVRRLLLPFDPSSVEREFVWAQRVAPEDDEPGAIRLSISFRGFPGDTLLPEVVPGASEVIWPDGTRGTVRTIDLRSLCEGEWNLWLLTTEPPADCARIPSVRIALDLHRATRLRRLEAVLGDGDTARFAFGPIDGQWTLSEDVEVTEFLSVAYRDPPCPLFGRGLAPRDVVALEDAEGRPLLDMGGGGASAVSINTWGAGFDRRLKPPVRVRVDVPLEWSTDPVVVTLEDLKVGH